MEDVSKPVGAERLAVSRVRMERRFDIATLSEWLEFANGLGADDGDRFRVRRL